MKILFVDDEPRVLSGLKRLLRKQRREWDMRFVAGGGDALKALESTQFDVLVTDMRMPDVDGCAVLTRSVGIQPNLIRLVLSGHTETEAALKAMPISHEFLSKPCKPEDLREALTRAHRLLGTLSEERLLSIVGQPGSLPARPKVYTELCAILAEPRSSMGDVVGLIESDIGLTMRILRVVNSSFFGGVQKIHDLQRAVTRLGSRLVKDLVLSAEVFDATTPSPGGISMERLYERANLTGLIARKLAGRALAQSAFLGGLLHEAGLLVMARAVPDALTECVQLARARSLPLHDVERQLLGVSHAEVGAYLMQFWGFPYSLGHAVANHLHPTTSASFELDKVVRVAHLAANEESPLIEGSDSGGLDDEVRCGVRMPAHEIRAWLADRRAA